MSFSITRLQMHHRTKTVTRRTGWRSLKPGDQILAVSQVRGTRLRDVDVYGVIEVVSVRREPLDLIDDADVAREGFQCDGRGSLSPRAPGYVVVNPPAPGVAAAALVRMFCEAMECAPDQPVTRIEFRWPE